MARWSLFVVGLVFAANVRAQNSSLFHRDLPVEQLPPPLLDKSSWTFIPVPPPPQIRVQDIVTIRVEELARQNSSGKLERRKQGLYDTVLKDWIQLIGLKAAIPDPQSAGEPRIQGTLQQQWRVQSELESRESLTFNVAARVADIRPNGTLVLEAHRQILINEEAWEYSLTGLCRREDVGPDNVVLSRNILDLRIHKRERGIVRDSYQRGWFLRWFDAFHPF